MATKGLLTQSAVELRVFARHLAFYETTIGTQATSFGGHLDRLGSSWSGPVPTRVTFGAHHWRGRLKPLIPAFAASRVAVTTWANLADAHAGDLPADDDASPEAATKRHEVQDRWSRVCAVKAGEIEPAMRAIAQCNLARYGEGVDEAMWRYDNGGNCFGSGGMYEWAESEGERWNPGEPNWQDAMRGQAPRATDLDLADLAGDVYGRPNPNDPGGPLGQGRWRRVTQAELPPGMTMKDFEDNGPFNGLRAALYVNDKGQYVLAFAGSQGPLNDWKITNPGQATGLKTPQFEAALRLGRTLRDRIGPNFVVTGHSLGGGIASYVALGTGAPAVTFNASGLHDNSLLRVGMTPQQGRAAAANGQVRAYHTATDALTRAQNNLGLPTAVGNPITIGQALPIIFGGRTIGPTYGNDPHSMEWVRGGLRGSQVTYSTNLPGAPRPWPLPNTVGHELRPGEIAQR